MKPRTSHLFVFALLGAALLISFNAWLALRSIQSLSKAEFLVEHTWRVIHSLEQVGDTLRDASAATQEYVLSGDLKYLQPYSDAVHTLPEKLDGVSRLIADNPDQQRALAELRTEIESEQSMLESRIQQRQLIRRGTAATASLLSSADHTQLDHGRSLVAQMQLTEQRLLVKRMAASSSDALLAKLAAIFASVVDLLLILFAFRSFVTERHLREHADLTADRLRKLESVSDVALTRLPVKDLNAELLARLRNVISADTVLLLTERDGDMVVEAGVGTRLAPGTVIPPAKGGPLHRALGRDRIIMISDTASDPIPFEIFRQHINSVAIAPLSGSRLVTGVIVAGRQAATAFDPSDQEVLSVAAGRIGISLDRANAYQAERQAREQAEASAQEVRLLNAELEKRVLQRTLELQATNQELEAFGYSVSHDLRAPLRTIDGFSLVLAEDYRDALDANARDYLRRIREGVQRMGHLIDSLLQLSRITRAELIREPVNMTALARAVAGELTAQNPERTMLFDIQPGLECMGDSRLLRAALENLLENAVKFTARQPEARIEVGRSEGTYFIRDNGVGFDSRYAHKLFAAFNRLHGDNEFRGSGIGLATVSRIIQRHHGKIWAESTEGQGATFWFTLG
jgi:signal transduction histidine kinase/CHASE3 domain sensor protein